MAARKPITETERMARRMEIAARYLKGQYQSTIAKALGVSQGQVSQDLDWIRAEWKKSAIRDFDLHKAEELRKTDHLEQTYWEGWERSCALAKKTVREAAIPRGAKEDDPRPRPTKATVTEEERDGNPAFLAGVERCIERRCKLLGLEAPEKKEVTGPNGGPVQFEVRAVDYRDAISNLGPAQLMEDAG